MNLKMYNIFEPCDESRTFFENQTTITTLSSYGNLLFVGTVDGRLLQCVFEEIEDGSTYYSFTLIFSRKVSDHPIACVSSSHYADLVAFLSNSRLQFLDSEKFEYSTVIHFIENVSTFSLFNGSSVVERYAVLAVAHVNGTLQIYRGTKTRFELFNVITLPAPAIVVCCIDEFAVVATVSSYLSVNLKLKQSCELFVRTDQNVRPLVQPISETEFLLSGPGSLGIFVNVSGASERPPIALSPNLSYVFCRNSLIFAVDDEFISIHSVPNQRQLQTLVLPGMSAACMSLNRDLMFLVSEGNRICTLAPETWEQEARRFILAGCTQEASQLITKNFVELTELCAKRPATSSRAKSVFTARSKRVYTLMGFYFFELGQFTTSREFFEKSSLDIRELLYRYVDLLPRGYAFTPNPDFNVAYASKARVSTDDDGLVHAPSTIFDLADSLDMIDYNVHEFRVFLLHFLQDNRHSRIFEQHTQFVETALVKLYVLLSNESSSSSIIDYGDKGEEGIKTTWEELVASLSTVDVEDLVTFLNENSAHHVKALLFRWNGDLVQGLDIWKRLAFAELSDAAFPGVDFYIDALFSALVQPLAFRGHCGSAGYLSPVAANERANQLTCGDTLFANQVYQHLADILLKSEQLQLAERFLVRLALITSWTNDAINDGSGLHPHPPTVSSSTIFPLSPGSILKQLLPHYPELAEKYLFVRVFQAHDSDTGRHIQLAETQLTLMLKLAEEKSNLLVKQRSRFRKTIMSLSDCPTDKLLEKIKSSSSFSTFFTEYIILLGKLGKYAEALELLVNERHNLRAALRFCDLCTTCQFQNRLVVEQSMWSCEKEVMANTFPCSKFGTKISDLYTILLKILFSSNDSGLRKSAMQLITADIPTLDFVEVLKLLPNDMSIEDAANFLRHALRSTITDVSVSEMELGLTSRLSNISIIELESGAPVGPLQVTESSICIHCNLSLGAYGPAKPFAWLLGDSKVMGFAHLHCIPGDSSV